MDDTLTPEQRHTASSFLSIVNGLSYDSVGLPSNPAQRFEVNAATGLANRLQAQLSPSMGGLAHKVWKLADEWSCLVAGHARGGRSPALGRRWLEARAAAPNLLPLSPATFGLLDAGSGPRFTELPSSLSDFLAACDRCGLEVLPERPHIGCQHD